MNVSNLFKKNAKRGRMDSFQKMEEKQLNKVLGGSVSATAPVTVTPDLNGSKSSDDHWDKQ